MIITQYEGITNDIEREEDIQETTLGALEANAQERASAVASLLDLPVARLQIVQTSDVVKLDRATSYLERFPLLRLAVLLPYRFETSAHLARKAYDRHRLFCILFLLLLLVILFLLDERQDPLQLILTIMLLFLLTMRFQSAPYPPTLHSSQYEHLLVLVLAYLQFRMHNSLLLPTLLPHFLSY